MDAQATDDGGTLPDGDGASPFSIVAAKSLPERRLRTLKLGDAFAVLDPFGDIPGEEDAPEGVYRRDTRLLSDWRLLIAGTRPLLLGSGVRNDNAFLSCDLTNPDLYDGDGKVVLPRESLHIHRVGVLGDEGYAEQLVIHNFGRQPVEIAIERRFGSDFADLFQVRGQHRQRRGEPLRPEVRDGEVRLAYRGLDGIERVTRIGFAPAPKTLDDSSALYELRIEPGRQAVLHASVGFGTATRPPHFDALRRHAFGARRQHLRLLPQLGSTNPGFAELLRRSRGDLAMLLTATPEGPYPYAGIPWFSTVFGRDALITALFTLWLAPEIARGVLRFLADHQARETDAAADAEPGKILHEMRHGEMANTGEVPFGRYYGSIDATPLFVLLAARYLERTGDLGTLRALWPAVGRALDWIDRYGDRDGDGFVEYFRQTEKGLANQGWKDSYDSVMHADGRLAQGPIALVEVQAYVYGAYRGGAAIARALGEEGRAEALDKKADDLRERFERAFWCERLGTYALALDGDKRPCEVLASNAGHALLTGIARPDRARSVAARLLGREGYSGWGIRTLGSGEVRFNPMSYHDGSVWPHDNAMIALGLARYGLVDGALHLLTDIAQAAQHFGRLRLPELFCGFKRRNRSGPVDYPVACSPQAWASAAPFALLDACLGLSFDPRAKEIRFVRPRLPEWLDGVEIHDLALGDAAVTLSVDRFEKSVVVRVKERRGEVGVVTEK